MLFIFDMGGVVTSTFKMDSLYNKLKLSDKDFKLMCKKSGRDIWHEFETGYIGANEFWKLYNNNIEGLNLPQVHNDLFRLYFHPVLNVRTVELIKKLRENHRVVCGTNTIQSHWENHMERGDYSFFDQTYASNKIGIAKPDPEFFKTILEAEGYSPENTYFTDDRIDNCESASGLGINVERFVSPDDLYNKWSIL